MANDIARHLANPLMNDITEGVIELCLQSTVFNETRPPQMTEAEWQVLVSVCERFLVASSSELDRAARVCEKYSNEEDSIGGTALMLYLAASRRATKN